MSHNDNNMNKNSKILNTNVLVVLELILYYFAELTCEPIATAKNNFLHLVVIICLKVIRHITRTTCRCSQPAIYYHEASLITGIIDGVMVVRWAIIKIIATSRIDARSY